MDTKVRERKTTKTLIVLTASEKEKAKRLSITLFGECNYSGLYAYFLSKSIE